jgi:DHA1 family tetracycline resistance protein-like MFS transporter
LLGAAFGLGFIIGPVIALVSLSVTGNNYHVPAFVAAGFSLGSIILNVVLLKETHQHKSASDARRVSIGLGAMIAALRCPQVGTLLALIFAQQLAFGGIQQLLSLFTLNRLGMNGSSNAALYVFVGVFVVAIQGYFIGRLSRKLGDRRLVYLGLAALALGTLMIAMTPAQPAPWYSHATVQNELTTSRQMPGETTPTQSLTIALPEDDTHNGWLGLGWLILAMIPASLGGGVLQPALNSLITRLAIREERGGLLGISAAFVSGANALAPLFGGSLFGWLGSSAPFLFSTALLAALLVVAWNTVRLNPAQAQSTPPTSATAAATD